jgi:hypothetical protein
MFTYSSDENPVLIGITIQIWVFPWKQYLPSTKMMNLPLLVENPSSFQRIWFDSFMKSYYFKVCSWDEGTFQWCPTFKDLSKLIP